jgi:hypothetical protein
MQRNSPSGEDLNYTVTKPDVLPVSEATPCYTPENHLVNLKSHENGAFALKMEAVASFGTLVTSLPGVTSQTIYLNTANLNNLTSEE